MKFKLFWKIYITIAATSITLILGLSYLNDIVETQMSYLRDNDRKLLLSYAEQADSVINSSPEKIAEWTFNLQQKEQTWLAIVNIQSIWLNETQAPLPLELGRSIDYPIHLYHADNPIFDIPLNTEGFHLLIQMPKKMRPGKYWSIVHLLITFLLPLLLVAVLSRIIYKNIIKPIGSLHRDTIRFKDGNFNARASILNRNRNDEIGDLTRSFNQMADSISTLITRQRQLVADISHELRTPITRLKLTLDGHYDDSQKIKRVSREVNYMTNLVEDILTLAWLNDEHSEIVNEDVDIVALLRSIVEDANFEFPDQKIITLLPEQCIIKNSNHRSIGQSIENIIRNAMKYSPQGSEVTISCNILETSTEIIVKDQGPGVPDHHLKDIFKPFFRVDKSRGRDSGGYGLGLALSERQINLVGGAISAKNNSDGGLTMSMVLPNSINHKK